jgi:hypothetical protein
MDKHKPVGGWIRTCYREHLHTETFDLTPDLVHDTDCQPPGRGDPFRQMTAMQSICGQTHFEPD